MLNDNTNIISFSSVTFEQKNQGEKPDSSIPPLANRGVINTSGAAGSSVGDNCILIDWLTFSSKSFDFDSMKCLLGLNDRTWVKGKASRLHYEYVYQFSGISIHYTNDDTTDKKYNTGVCVEMYGQGCFRGFWFE